MKALKENHAIKIFLKSSLVVTALLLVCGYTKAQDKPLFPFQGGITVMDSFFKDSLTVSPDIIEKRATGTVTFKFSADRSGIVKNILIYYADDILLTPPLIEALRKSSHKWIIPDNEKLHDFIITFSINFNPPATGNTPLAIAGYRYYKKRRPIIAADQIPVASSTMLPPVMVTYDIPR